MFDLFAWKTELPSNASTVRTAAVDRTLGATSPRSQQPPSNDDAYEKCFATRGGPTEDKQALLASRPPSPAERAQDVAASVGTCARVSTALTHRLLAQTSGSRPTKPSQVTHLVQKARTASIAGDAETGARLIKEAFAAYQHHRLHGAFARDPFFGLPAEIHWYDWKQNLSVDGALPEAFDRDHNEVSVATLLSVANKFRNNYKYHDKEYVRCFAKVYWPAVDWMDRHGRRALGAILRGDDDAAVGQLRALQAPLAELRSLIPPDRQPFPGPKVPGSLAVLLLPGFAPQNLVPREDAGAQLVDLLLAKRCTGALAFLLQHDDGFLPGARCADLWLAQILGGERAFENAQRWTLPFYSEVVARLKAALLTPQTCGQAQAFLRGLQQAHPDAPASLRVGLLQDERVQAALPNDVAAWLLA